jgi:TonB family protein
MTRRARPRGTLAAGVLLVALACRGREDGTIRLGEHQPATESPADQPPVAVNPVSPMEYPQALLDEGIGGRVLLRLFVDSTGQLVADSTRLAESSGYPALDSAALAGAPALRFSPALRNGRPIAAPFLQPVQFRNPRARSETP